MQTARRVIPMGSPSRLFGLGRRALATHLDAAALLMIVGLGAAARVVLFFLAPVFVDGDSFQYYRPAHLLMDGTGFPLPLKRPPAYPVFLALIGNWLGEDLRYIAAVQHVLGLGTAALAYGVGRLTFGRLAGLVGGLVAAFSGGLLIYEHYIMTESLFAFLLTGAVYLYLAGLRAERGWCYVGSGLVIGLAAMTRPHAQMLLLTGAVVAAVHFRRWRSTLRAVILTSVAAGLVLVPWMARNHAVHGVFTVAGGVGQHLVRQTAITHAGDYVFLQADRRENSDPRRAQARELIQKLADAKAKDGDTELASVTVHGQLVRNLRLREAEADALMQAVALEAITTRPLTYARLSLEDLRLIFVGDPEELREHWSHAQPGGERARLTELMRRPSPEQQRSFPVTERLVNLYQSARLGPLVPGLFLLGLVSSLLVPAWRLALLPGLAVLSLNLVSAAAVGFTPRFHHPPDPLVHVVAFGGVLVPCRLMADRLLQGAAPMVRARLAAGLRGGRAEQEPTERLPRTV